MYVSIIGQRNVVYIEQGQSPNQCNPIRHEEFKGNSLSSIVNLLKIRINFPNKLIDPHKYPTSD